MPAGAVGLVAIAAVCHASWNLITKRTGGGIAFLWLFGITATILMLPVAWIEVAHMDRSLQRQDLIAVLGSGFIHIFYFSLLQNGYRTGDLSVVYPVARGVGPLLAAVVSIAMLGDRPGALAIAGGLALLAGVVGMSGLTLGKVKLDQSVVLGLLTGVSIACYTLWDRRSVATLELPPVFYYWASTAAYTMFVTPAVLANGRSCNKRCVRAAPLASGCRGRVAERSLVLAGADRHDDGATLVRRDPAGVEHPRRDRPGYLAARRVHHAPQGDRRRLHRARRRGPRGGMIAKPAHHAASLGDSVMAKEATRV